MIHILFLLSGRVIFTEMGSTRNRRRTDPEIVIARDTDSELSSAEEEEEEEENNYPLSESEEEDEAVKNGGKIELEKNKAKGKAPITVKLIKKVCKVTLYQNPSFLLRRFSGFHFLVLINFLIWLYDFKFNVGFTESKLMTFYL